MHLTPVRLLILLILVIPTTLLAQTPPPEPFNEEGYILSNAPTQEAAGVVATACGTVSGTRFNLEPRAYARAQHTTSLDFLRNRVSPGVDLVIGTAQDTRSPVSPPVGPVGHYVSRNSTCAPEFEGPLGVGGPLPLRSIHSGIRSTLWARVETAAFGSTARRVPRS